MMRRSVKGMMLYVKDKKILNKKESIKKRKKSLVRVSMISKAKPAHSQVGLRI